MRGPVKVGAPTMYWNRLALTARFEKTECAEDSWEKYRVPAIDFQPSGQSAATTVNGTGSPRAGFEASARCHLGIRFVVKNNTPDGVEIKRGTLVWPWVADSGSFDRSETHGARIGEDASVPAGLTATAQILTDDRCEGKTNSWETCLKQDFGKVGSLVMFLKGTRYEVELPLR